MKKSCLLILVSLSFFIGACGQKVRTTNVAATTGGALGAAIGAMVGNQTGSTAGGLILGGAAGAGTGYAIGKTFEGQENQIANQREEIARHNQMLAAQQAELDELKRLSSDNISYKNERNQISNLRGVPNRRSYESGELASKIKRNIDLEERSLELRRNTQTANRRGISLQNSYRVPNTIPAYQERSINSAANIEKRNKPVIKPKIADSNSVNTIDSKKVLAERNIASNRAESEVLYNLKNNTKKVNKKGSIIVSDLSSDASSPRGSLNFESDSSKNRNDIKRKVIVMDEEKVSDECKEAKKEYDSALKADEVSDKLYHYRRALRLCPQHAGYHTGLGKIYLSLNRYEDARYEFKEALKIDPDFNPAKEQMSSME